MAAIDQPFSTTGGSYLSPLNCGGIWALEEVTRIANLMRSEPARRKALLWITEAIEVYPQPLCNLDAVRKALDRAVRLANLTVSVIDPVGLDTDINSRSPLGPARLARFDRLGYYPQLTGGRLIINTNTPEALVPAIMGESSSYYLVGFTPPEPAKNARHEVEVKVKGRGLTVTAPTGYGAAPDPKSRADQPPPIIDVANAKLRPDQHVALSVAAAPFADAGRKTASTVVVIGVPNVSGAKLKLLTLDSRVRDVRPPYEASLAFSRAAPLRDGDVHEVRTSVVLAPGKYELRAAVETADGRTGSVFTYVDVPDFLKAPLSLSGVVIDALPATSSVRMDAAADFLPVTPTIRRAFTGADTLHICMRAYEGGDEAASAVDVNARLLDAQGTVRRNLQMHLDAARFTRGESDVTITLPLAGLNAGEYLLSIAAIRGEHRATREVRLTIQ